MLSGAHRATRYSVVVHRDDDHPDRACEHVQSSSRRKDAVKRAQVIGATWPTVTRVEVLDTFTPWAGPVVAVTKEVRP